MNKRQVLNSKEELVLPDPDLEDDDRNGEVDPKISGLVNSITEFNEHAGESGYIFFVCKYEISFVKVTVTIF